MLILGPVPVEAQNHSPRHERPQGQSSQHRVHSNGSDTGGRPERPARRAAPSRTAAPQPRGAQADRETRTHRRLGQRGQSLSVPTYRGHGRHSGRFQRQHAAPFRYPRGYGHRRWSVGLLLPRIFLGSRYYYSDYRAFGVGTPPYGYRWIRYGSDLLLVKIRTGRIRRVIQGAFH
ncbi:MAG: hypothetical protein B7Y45_02265 [Sphingomonas sp. 28-66-16]|nr:MAG: hypothetical protein B7Y45_02265 [Sphingomonas sp. 28-66-16]